ncbi:WD repeat-containing protein 20-like [Saccoglossus kowalevskii]|uniref:WD repeat-containing protein 20-like n=1 Tax=Saccoglossus kowalevskii TaxID=10224 RepID=A0ABM0GTQ6_SACKO|nr:PREDICTED: WD repeat-containing protein 20-like [Saccoglossus kowalevskii]
MAAEGGGKDEVKTQFTTREGTYKLMTLSEYSRPNRVPYSAQSCNPVKVSFINVKDPSGGDRICFNVGKELYFYIYKGIRKAADLTKPIEKRTYKGTIPTCHDFNQFTCCSQSVSLLVGFSAGQVQLIDPIKKDNTKLFNEERLIDKTRVTCLRWVPGSEHLFLVAHSSGNMYLYNEQLAAGNAAPHYQTHKHGDGYAIYTCKSKSTRNPVFRWVVGEGSLNDFAFSPDATYLATVSQDGFLRIFHYDSMDLHAQMKSYFGGLLCACWSPDSKYIVTGGEDDLVTVYSFLERKVIARGRGHKSWVSVVAFDSYLTQTQNNHADFFGSDDDFNSLVNSSDARDRAGSRASAIHPDETRPLTCTYRFGSAGQDTQMCLWDLTEDVLYPHQPLSRGRTNTNPVNPTPPRCNSIANTSRLNANATSHTDGIGTMANLTSKISGLNLSDKHKDKLDKSDKKNSVSSRSGDKLNSLSKMHRCIIEDAMKAIGTPMCPRLDEVPMLEPLVVKKIAHERLTALVFREDCLVTSCQEGFVCTWARPGKVGMSQHNASGTVV